MPGWEGGGWVGITCLSNIHVLLTGPAIYIKSPHSGFEEKNKLLLGHIKKMFMDI